MGKEKAMIDKTAFELKKDKFEYEVKEFRPVIRKNPRSRKVKIIFVVVAALLLVFIGIGLYKTFIYKEKLAPEDACKRALTDCSDHLWGKESYVLKDINGDIWYDLLTQGCYEVDASIKLKSLGDFGLGFEKMASGAGIKGDAVVNAADKRLMGSLDITWTIMTVPVLEYTADSDKLVISSPEFIEESILLYKKDMDISDRTIGNLYMELTGETMEESPYTDMTIREMLDMVSFECTYSSLEEKTLVVCGKEESCYGIKVTAANGILTEPVEIILYVDKDYRLVSLEASHNSTTDEGVDAGFDLRLSFEGKKHPADKIKGELLLFAGEDKIEGSFSYGAEVTEEELAVSFKGELLVCDIRCMARAEMGYVFESNSFTIDVTMNDSYDTIDIEANGDITNDTDGGILKLAFDKLAVDYNGSELFTAGIKLGFSAEEDKPEIYTEPKEPVLNLIEMDEEDFMGLYQQIMDKIGYYEEMLEDFL
ncbi:MAG: hypothetical protein ACI39R_05545 [Lachnospiraceae bacterium]